MKTYAFIDASNLFYGGEKSLGWKIDYQKLIHYLQKKYQITKAYYFGGVETYSFPNDYLRHETVPIRELERYLVVFIDEQGSRLNEAELMLIGKHLQRIRFYLLLNNFGYQLILKPVKTYTQDDGTTKRKANCDVDMTFYMMKEMSKFDRAVILSGDGDFLPVLKYLQENRKEVLILARGKRTAREIKQFAGANFRDFVRLEHELKFEGK